MNFKMNSRPLFTVMFKLKNDNFMALDFSPLIERVLTGVSNVWYSEGSLKKTYITMALVTTPVCPRAAPRAKPGKINLKKIGITFKLKQV